MLKRKNHQSAFTRSLFDSDLPEDWRLVPVGDALLGTQYGLSEPGDSTGNTPIVGMRDLNNGSVNLIGLATVDDGGADWTGMQLRRGDILLNRTNSADLVGKVGIVREDSEAVFASYLVRLDVDREKAEPEYVNYWLNTAIAQTALKRLSTRGVSQANINPTEFRKHCPLPLPPIPEQRKVAKILRTWDEAIEKLEALRAAKEEQFRGLQQKLIDQDFKSYGDTLEQYALIPNLENITSVNGLKPLTVKLHCKGIMANGRNVPVTLSDKGRPYYRRKAGDVLIGRQNFHNGGFGIVPPELDGFIASNAITSLRVDSSKIDVHYLFYFFSRKDYYLRIGHIMDGTGQKELSDKQIRKLPVSIPSLEKQVEVVQILNAANEEISLIDTKIEALTRQKRGLMQKLLTGEWRVAV